MFKLIDYSIAIERLITFLFKKTRFSKKYLWKGNQNPMKFWLDDVRQAPPGYVWVHSVNIMKTYIELCEKNAMDIDLLDLDHDMGDFEKDGGDGIKLIDWLIERETFYPIKLHTMNPVGRMNMMLTISRYWPKN